MDKYFNKKDEEALRDGAWHKGRKQDFGVNDFRYKETLASYWDNRVLTVSTYQDTSQCLIGGAWRWVPPETTFRSGYRNILIEERM
ncbi:hypothetical protein Tco_1102782 [Tanacetum coccineum]